MKVIARERLLHKIREPFKLSQVVIRNAEFTAGELCISEAAAANIAVKLPVATRDRRVTAVDHSKRRRLARISGNAVKKSVGHYLIFLGKIQKVVHRKIVGVTSSDVLILHRFMAEFVISGMAKISADKEFR